MRFWTWALGAYARPGTGQACLDLQDRYDQCVPYLLWAAWAAQEGRTLERRMLEAGSDLCARWETAAVGPLRDARRAMKPEVRGIAEGAREALRAEVKALELRAERLLIETLEDLAPDPASAAFPIAPALVSAAAVWPAPAPEEALDRLAQTLS
jgi:uncharacterized protein (TIGR02444 family)